MMLVALSLGLALSVLLMVVAVMMTVLMTWFKSSIVYYSDDVGADVAGGADDVVGGIVIGVGLVGVVDGSGGDDDCFDDVVLKYNCITEMIMMVGLKVLVALALGLVLSVLLIIVVVMMTALMT